MPVLFNKGKEAAPRAHKIEAERRLEEEYSQQLPILKDMLNITEKVYAMREPNPKIAYVCTALKKAISAIVGEQTAKHKQVSRDAVSIVSNAKTLFAQMRQGHDIETSEQEENKNPNQPK